MLWRFAKWLLYCATVVVCSILIANYIDNYFKCLCYVGTTVLLSVVCHKWLDMYRPMPQVIPHIVKMIDEEVERED